MVVIMVVSFYPEKSGASSYFSPYSAPGEVQLPHLYETQLSIHTGIRMDRLRWNIAGNNVNILSELIVDDIEIIPIGLKTEITRGNYTFFGNMAYGEIRDGTTTDRDYLADDRRGLYSESISKVSGNHAIDLSGSIGRNIDFKADRFRLAPVIGASWHRLKLYKTHGVQTVATSGVTPPTGPFPGLASSYDASWTSLWAGGNIRIQIISALQLTASFHYHWFDYRADADWNLRQDLAHPVSFTHRASGDGFDAEITCKYAFTDRADISITFFYRDWLAKNGTDTTFFATGQRAEIPLNEVSWESRSITAGIHYRF